MTEFTFLNREQLDELHEYSLAAYGGAAGIRDEGLIESALGAAYHTLHYGNGGVFDITATYAFHIAQAQAFFDGNKRTAIASSIAFLAQRLSSRHNSKHTTRTLRCHDRDCRKANV